jgi:hypothetical protein
MTNGIPESQIVFVNAFFSWFKLFLSTLFFCEVSRRKERGLGMPPTSLDKWLKKVTPDDTGLTRPPPTERVSVHKD